jgi:hypothetical protein
MILGSSRRWRRLDCSLKAVRRSGVGLALRTLKNGLSRRGKLVRIRGVMPDLQHYDGRKMGATKLVA